MMSHRKLFFHIRQNRFSVNSICCSSTQCASSVSSNVDKSKYILAMFPYPSGRLHMGHLRVYTLSDVLHRYYALNGHRVLHPIGWDAFGLPAENAAIERGVDSAEWTYSNIEEMRAQLLKTGVKFHWDRELFTCRPDYFRWTQWIFLQLYKHGFVRKAFSEVNWDPVDNTVLADEQVDANGHSWRSGALVEKRLLNQWVVDTPRYAKQLLDGLAPLEFEWDEVANNQSSWIGTCDVFRFLLPIKNNSPNQPNERLDLRIHDPLQFCTAQFVLLTNEHHIAKEAAKRGLLNGAEDFAILDGLSVPNFVTGRPMPLVVLLNESDKGEEEGDGHVPFHKCSRLGFPASNEPIDRAIGDRLHLEPLPQPQSVQMDAEQVLKLAESLQFGGYQTSRTLHDWVVSRQRAWGTPIPMVLEEGGGDGIAPLEDDQLPMLGKQRGKRVEVPSFPSGWGRLEMDTLDTYFDSSWYFLRFLDPHNGRMAFEPAIARREMPVDVYVGGVEHAKMHLLYARFICHFLHSLGLLPQREPFARFIPLGIVRSRSYQLIATDKYVPPSEVDGDARLPDAKLVHRPSGEPVRSQFEKMSKSKHNGVDPLDVIDKFGVDLTRLQLLFEAHPSHLIDWPYPYPTYQIKYLRRWLGYVESLVQNYAACVQKEGGASMPDDHLSHEMEAKLRDIYNRHVKMISLYLEVLRHHHMALIRLIDMTKEVLKLANSPSSPAQLMASPQMTRCVHALVVMMQLFAPQTAAKHWELLRSAANADAIASCRMDASVEAQKWPSLDPRDTVDFLIVIFDTPFLKPALRSDVEALDDAQLERHAREKSHAAFFRRLEEKSLRIVSTSVERMPGLCIVLNLKMGEEVAKGTVIEIIRKYGGEGGEMKKEEDEKKSEGGKGDDGKRRRRKKQG